MKTFRLSRCGRRILVIIAASLLLGIAPAHAHKASDSYLTIRPNPDGQLAGEWHLALRDLEYAIGLDANDDGLITWKELRSQQAAVVAYACAHLHISDADTNGQIQVTQMLVDHHSDGAYAVLRFSVSGLRRDGTFDVDYRAFFDLDPLHRGLLNLESRGATRVAVFIPTATKQHFELGEARPSFALVAFIREGIWHIWTGYDHLLFLLALLLPAVLRRRASEWEPQRAIYPILKAVLRTITAFTVAHSITLSLAALEILQLPPRLVESAIAASVVLAALNNLVPVFSEKTWLVAFLFGLVHGFGFANALVDLGLRNGTFAIGLFGFNFGVELGQLAVVGLFLLPAALLRDRPFYRYRFMPISSALITLMAGTWFVERVWDVKWVPF